MATEEPQPPEAEPEIAGRERQASTYDDLNALTFGALKRLASENEIRMPKFPKKHDIIKKILIEAEGNEEVAASVSVAAPHVVPEPVRQSSREAAPESATSAPAQKPKQRHVGFVAQEQEERKERTPSRGANARQRAATTAVRSNSRGGDEKDPSQPFKPPLRTVFTMGNVNASKPHHRPRASSLPAKATLDTAELFTMNFTQLKNHALNLGLELPRVPTKGKILRMILAYQPDDLDTDPDSDSEENVQGDEKEDKEPEDSPPAVVPDAAPAAVVTEEKNPSDVRNMWRKKSSEAESSSRTPTPEPGKKSNLMSMWQNRADADKTPPATDTTSGPPKRGGGKVSKFANMFANQNIPVGGSRPPGKRMKSPSPTPSISPSPVVTPVPSPAVESSPALASASATEEKKAPESSSEAAPAGDGPPVKTREELDAMGFKALKLYIKNDLGLPLPRVPNRANCIKAILKHQSGGDADEEPKRHTIKLKPKPKPKDVASEIGGTSIADRLKMIAASQANHGVPPPGGGSTEEKSSGGGRPKPKKISDRFPQNNSSSNPPVDERPRPRPKKKKIGKIGKIGGMGMAINVAALRPGFRPKARARSSSMVTTQLEFNNLELLRPTIQSGRRKSRMKGPSRDGVASRILVEDEDD